MEDQTRVNTGRFTPFPSPTSQGVPAGGHRRQRGERGPERSGKDRKGPERSDESLGLRRKAQMTEEKGRHVHIQITMMYIAKAATDDFGGEE